MPRPPESAKQDERYKAARELAFRLPNGDGDTIKALLTLVDEIDSMGEDL